MKYVFYLPVLAFVCAGAVTAVGQDFNIQLRSTLDYPAQTLANICGYAQNGHEYALVGASRGLSIVEVTNPDNPVEIVQIPGPDNLWKEIKVYSHYAYVVSEGGGGVQIIDLAPLPGANLNHHFYTGTGEINEQLGKIHALHIDETAGFLYTYGGNFSSARVHDLNIDPYNPVYVGKFDQLGYIHDGYVDNDTLYACHINSGLLSIVDMRDKLNPALLGTVETPSRFTHNSWLLADRKHILTTDERIPSFLTAYDITDPTDIKELDRFSTNDGNGSIGHNTHVLNDWAITSWYTDGFSIVDASHPENLVQVGFFDTWPGTGPDFDGCWGVYPFLPSGNILATNIPNTNGGTGRLFVLTPTYARASYLEGQITDGCTGQPLRDAEVRINGNAPIQLAVTDNTGRFKTGSSESGIFTATISKLGFVTQTIDITLTTGETSILLTTLEPSSAYNVQAHVASKTDLVPLANTTIILTNVNQTYQLQTDGNGNGAIDCMLGGVYRAGAWGFLPADVSVSADGDLDISLTPAYYDDFELDLGWSNASNANAGFWTLGEPVGTTLFDVICNPDEDWATDNNNQCYVTGNAGGGAGNDDVDGGAVTLTTPLMQLGKYSDAVLSFYYWFYNGGGNGSPNDQFEVKVGNGQQIATVFAELNTLSEWRYSGEIHLKDHLPLTDNMRVQFIASDVTPGHVVEAAVDVFQVTPGLVAAFEPDPAAEMTLSPNPSAAAFQLRYAWPAVQDPVLEVRNLLGQMVIRQELHGSTGILRFGERLPAGMYLVWLSGEGRRSVVLKAMKQ
ncbi:MAG: choice-of-anchor B family protein [Saprospirales bacterium]|nr:choice-of-anchor B family protein [Saprospirales bacterium]